MTTSVYLSIKTKIAEYLKLAHTENNYGPYWEIFKYELRNFLRKAGANMVKNSEKEENCLLSELVSLSSTLPENLSEEQRAKLQTLQLQLDQIYIKKAKGAFICSRAK